MNSSYGLWVTVLIVLYALIRGLWEQFLEIRLKMQGKLVQARVKERITQNNLFRTRRAISFVYIDDNNQQHEWSQDVGKKHLERLIDNQLVAVRFLPNDPKIARLADKDADHLQRDRWLWLSLTIGSIVIPVNFIHPLPLWLVPVSFVLAFIGAVGLIFAYR